MFDKSLYEMTTHVRSCVIHMTITTFLILDIWGIHVPLILNMN